MNTALHAIEHLGEARPKARKGRLSRRSPLLVLPSLVLVVALPFLLDYVLIDSARIAMLVCVMLLTPLLALQAYDQNQGLEAIIASIGERIPRISAERRRLYGTSMLLAVAATVQCVAVIVAVRTSFIPPQQPADASISFNVALIVIVVGALVGPLHGLKRVVISAGPAVILVLGHYGIVNPVKIALWEAAMTEVSVLVLMRLVTAETLGMAEHMLAETREAEEASAGTSTSVRAP